MTNQLSPIAKHKWASGGVSSYPLSHPIVGQGEFFETFKQFIHVTDNESEKFAHVFAMIAQWGIGKSRLAYELIAQINDTSPGWYVRDPAGSLTGAKLFYNDSDREQYLGLYIRYSQIANEYQNMDNWFGYGLYKALLPLARGGSDGSIQDRIAKEAGDRLMVLGFEETKLAEALELSANHTDEILYEDPILVTRLCQAAYDYLQQFGINYILVALDELETVAETSTYGLEDSEIKHLDGRAIKLIGKAIKEEDPRRKLPWLRYVALCSPAVGDELREIQSTARRFELVELSRNSFADVSDFVLALERDGQLSQTYPSGLVEAAYAMSGGNFGWFNVIMANIDERLRNRQGEKDQPSVGTLFDECVKTSSRIRDHVLDHNAINELRLADRDAKAAARELLYSQLPVPLSQWRPEELKVLLTGTNEYDEPIALRYRRVEWDDLDCSKALSSAKFHRDKDKWYLTGVDQPLNLKQLLDNLSTYAVHESRQTQATSGKRILLIPLGQSEFIQLVGLLSPHPAAEYAARALWQSQIGSGDLNESEATHIGPSIAMLERLNLRYRKQSLTSLIFRDPDQSTAHQQVMQKRKNQPPEERLREILTGLMRILDQNWKYDPINAGLGNELVAIATSPGSRSGDKGGLINYNALKLHPKDRLILAWVRNIEELELLCHKASDQFLSQGKTPVLVFTPSRSLIDLFNNPSSPVLKNAHSYLHLYQLNTSEELTFQRVGLPLSDCQDFELNSSNFNSSSSNRINSLLRSLEGEIKKWRQKLDAKGYIAWPLRPSGTPLKDSERNTLFKAWCYLILNQQPPRSLAQLDERQDVNAVTEILQKLKISAKASAAGYGENERAMLFDNLDDRAEAVFPPFLVRILEKLLQGSPWTQQVADREWFWGYSWQEAKPKNTFIEWMSLACDLGFAAESSQGASSKDKTYSLKTCSELRNLINEANNWLNDDYPKIVADMEVVFGEGKVRELFGALSGMRVGTKTANAVDKIKLAQNHLSALETAEGAFNFNASKTEKEQVLLASGKRRLELIDAIKYVYLDDEYQRLSDDEYIKTLSFENDSEPLWRRIGRAKIFATKVLNLQKRISDRIDWLSNEMKSEVQGLSNFPTQLFTLSLEKIRNILEGALQTSTPQGSTARKQGTEAGTLGQSLKDLRVADAINRLAQLAREVGIDIDSSHEASLAEIDGQIVNGFCSFKQAYEHIYSQLTDAQVRLKLLTDELQDAPSDFDYPSDSPSLSELQKRLSLIEDAFITIKDEDVDRLRSDRTYDTPAKLGNFQPLMQEAQKLIDTPKNQLKNLLGQVATLENAVTGYRRSLLNAKDVKSIERGLNALLKAKDQEQRQPLELPELKAAGSLKAVVAKLDERRGEWVQAANSLLASTNVSFERWRRIVEAFDEERDPQLTPEEDAVLVSRGFLIRTYRLGGK